MGATALSSWKSKPFSEGVKFKSKHITLLLFDLFTTGTARWISESMDKDSSGQTRFSFKAATALCRLMWPPSACPIANSSPHIEHSWVLGLGGEICNFVFSFTSPSVNLGFLWLALWPPRAWKDGNWRLHVLHSKTRISESTADWKSPPRERSMRQFAMVFRVSNSPSLPLFMPTYIMKYIGKPKGWGGP